MYGMPSLVDVTFRYEGDGIQSSSLLEIFHGSLHPAETSGLNYYGHYLSCLHSYTKITDLFDLASGL